MTAADWHRLDETRLLGYVTLPQAFVLHLFDRENPPEYRIKLVRNRRRVSKKRTNFVCTIEGCGRPAKSKQLCALHYHRQRVGKPLNTPLRARITTRRTRFTEWRTAKSLTLLDIATALDVSRQCIWNYEFGLSFPKGDNLTELSRILGVTPEDLRLHYGEQRRLSVSQKSV